MSEPTRHHYIPVFYLRQWAGRDGRLCEYSRPYRETKATRKHPAATAYIDNLYTVPGLPIEQTQFVEKKFLQLVDSGAAQAMTAMLKQTEPGYFERLEVGGHCSSPTWYVNHIMSSAIALMADSELIRLGNINCAGAAGFRTLIFDFVSLARWISSFVAVATDREPSSRLRCTTPICSGFLRLSEHTNLASK